MEKYFNIVPTRPTDCVRLKMLTRRQSSTRLMELENMAEENCQSNNPEMVTPEFETSVMKAFPESQITSECGKDQIATD